GSAPQTTRQGARRQGLRFAPQPPGLRRRGIAPAHRGRPSTPASGWVAAYGWSNAPWRGLGASPADDPLRAPRRHHLAFLDLGLPLICFKARAAVGAVRGPVQVDGDAPARARRAL